jgi:hypothetical protein
MPKAHWLVPFQRNVYFVGHESQLNELGAKLSSDVLRKFFYRDLEDLAPTDKGIFTGTPMVNSDVMDKIRAGKAQWLREATDRGQEWRL